MTIVEVDENDQFFDRQLEKFQTNSLIADSLVPPVDLRNSLMEEHNFFNGVSPANNAYAINKDSICESFDADHFAQ